MIVTEKLENYEKWKMEGEKKSLAVGEISTVT